MTKLSVAQRTRPRNTFVAPLAEVAALPDYQHGQVLYYQNRPLSECFTDSQAQGYLDTEAAIAIADIRRGAKGVN
jgi:hypothetical protein